MSNANKVKVSKEVAEAIEQLRKSQDDEKILYQASSVILEIGRFKRKDKSAIVTLHEISPMKLARALINGYEIEQTPAEKVAEQYRNRSELFERFEHDEDLGAMIGIKFVADAYGLKIEGVNA